MEIQPVNIVTIKNIIPLFKNNDVANSIELIEFEENGFQVVAQKDLYSVGDNAIYIQPDYCVPETELFESFIRPLSDPKKSKLGRNNRIRAIKFNLHTGNGLAIYSQGILLPHEEVCNMLTLQRSAPLHLMDLTKELGITKYVEPEDNGHVGGVKGGRSQGFPQGMYKTDETNINNLWGHIKFPIRLIGREKVDGSSITLYCKNGKAGIASRNLDKPLSYPQIIGKRKPSIVEKIKRFFGFKTDLFIYEIIESDSDFVKYGKQYLKPLQDYCDFIGFDVALRGELNGSHLKGSGNSKNPARLEKPNIKFYGLDIYNDQTVKAPESEFINACEAMGLVPCKLVFDRIFESRIDLENECNLYFKDNMIEGIVVRTPDHNTSAKVMNPEYDAKK